MHKFVLISSHIQSETSEDVLILTAEGYDAIPVDVQPFDPNNDFQVKEANSLRDSIKTDPDPMGHTVARLAYSYGNIRELED